MLRILTFGHSQMEAQNHCQRLHRHLQTFDPFTIPTALSDVPAYNTTSYSVPMFHIAATIYIAEAEEIGRCSSDQSQARECNHQLPK
jgi:hypothetical protein